jgi:addiction module HigA family antidote
VRKKATTRYQHEPDYAVAPGETLAETIETLGMDQRELARRTGLHEHTLSQIINGHAAITAESAIKLERATGVPASMWNNLEATYRERLARIEDRKRLERDLGWLKTIPLRELIRRGLVEPLKDPVAQLQAALAFFGVNSPAEWEKQYLETCPAYRKSNCFQAEPGATSAWLRIGQLRGMSIEAEPYDASGFRKALFQARALTTEPPATFEPRLKELCRQAGVALVFVKEIKGCPVSGATRWLTPTRPLIQMTLRYKTNDHFWFTFFHEAGHIVNDSKKEVYIEDQHHDAQREQQANRFAADLLIPPAQVATLPGLKTKAQVMRFSQDIGIAPGIVVGRLQKDGVIRFSHMNDLKVRFAWSEVG